MDLVEILTERRFLWSFPRASCWGLFFRLNFMFFENWSIIRPEWWLQFALRHEETMWFLYLNSGLTCLPMLGADNKTTSSSRTKWRLFSASTCKERPLHFFFTLNTTKSLNTIMWMETKRYQDLPDNWLFFFANPEETSLFPGVLCTTEEQNKPGKDS